MDYTKNNRTGRKGEKKSKTIGSEEQEGQHLKEEMEGQQSLQKGEGREEQHMAEGGVQKP